MNAIAPSLSAATRRQRLSKSPTAGTHAIDLTVLHVHRMLLPDSPPVKGQNYVVLG